MLRNILSAVTLALFLAGCVNSPEENKVMLQKYTQEYSKYSVPLDNLREANLAINARRISYKPVLLWNTTFGDLSFSEDRKYGHLNLLSPDFSEVLNSKQCANREARTEEAASTCFAGFYRYAMDLTPIGVERAINNADDSLKVVYASLTKLDALISKVPQEHKKYIRQFLESEFTEKYTMDQFASAVDSFVSSYGHELIVSKLSSVAEENEAMLIAKQLATEEKLQREKEEKIRRKRERLELAEFNSKRKSVWVERNSHTYSIGEKVCDYENSMGFVEDVSEFNIKIQMYGKAVGPKGIFFGNMPNVSYEYRFDRLDNIIWVSKGEYATCNFSI